VARWKTHEVAPALKPVEGGIRGASQPGPGAHSPEDVFQRQFYDIRCGQCGARQQKERGVTVALPPSYPQYRTHMTRTG
jgi:hypothetical protein